MKRKQSDFSTSVADVPKPRRRMFKYLMTGGVLGALFAGGLGLASNAGRVLSRDALMERLRGHDADAVDRSLDVHVSRIRAAIEDDPKTPRRILTVRGAGYLFARAQS